MYEIWGFQGGDDSSRGLLDSDVVTYFQVHFPAPRIFFLKMEAAKSSDTLSYCITVRRQKPEDLDFNPSVS